MIDNPSSSWNELIEFLPHPTLNTLYFVGKSQNSSNGQYYTSIVKTDLEFNVEILKTYSESSVSYMSSMSDDGGFIYLVFPNRPYIAEVSTFSLEISTLVDTSPSRFGTWGSPIAIGGRIYFHVQVRPSFYQSACVWERTNAYLECFSFENFVSVTFSPIGTNNLFLSGKFSGNHNAYFLSLNLSDRGIDWSKILNCPSAA